MEYRIIKIVNQLRFGNIQYRILVNIRIYLKSREEE